MIDTHTHLYLDEFSSDCDEVMHRAIESGVERMIFPNVDLSTVGPMLELHSRYPQNTFVAMGLHPTEVKETWRDDLAKIESLFDNSSARYVAVGEIGIDLYWDKTFRNEQMKVFARQVEIALDRNLPIIIHCRDGLDEVLEVLDAASAVPRGVFHSFGGTVEDVARIRQTGDFYFGINGIVTFKNSRLREVLPTIGPDRILLETDAPYLAPVPHRGKRNESSFLPATAAVVADALALPVDKVDRATSQNAVTLFGLT